jgi:hypothetical protein
MRRAAIAAGGHGIRQSLRAFLAAIAPALFAASAYATTCEYTRGGTTVYISGHADAAAQVTIINRLASPGNDVCNLDLDGLAVSVEYDAGPGDKPDAFITTPPEGYFAAPDWLLVDDGASATVLIWPLDDFQGM